MDDDAKLIAAEAATFIFILDGGLSGAITLSESVRGQLIDFLRRIASRPSDAALQARVEELERMLEEADAAHAGYSVVYSEHRTRVNMWREEAIARYRARTASATGDAEERSKT